MRNTRSTHARCRGAAVLYIGIILVAAIATVLVLMLLDNISTRKHEAQQTVFSVVKLDETVVDPAEWGKNFPRQYDSYKRTVDMVQTRYGGSEALPDHGISAAPKQAGKTDESPRPAASKGLPAQVPLTTSKIEADPRLKTMWNGYAFAVDFREERGHAYMLHDQRDTERVKQFNQPGSCLQCHASNATAYRAVGIQQGAPGKITDSLTSPNGYAQLMKGFEQVCALPYAEATKLVEHPVACIDCHDPGTLQLRVTRPGFLNGIQRLAESADPVPHLPSVERWRTGSRSRPYDPNTDASRQEMRSFVCGQCHVEYYFHGPGKLVTYPWHNGLKADQMEAYYDNGKFTDKDGNVGPFYDWKHKTTAATALKAQHPEFEMWSQGIHARSGVACADCHMPYVREGAIKVSDHQVRSPLLNVNRSCQTCHRFPEAELKARAEAIQDRTKYMMDRSLDALVQLIADIERAQASGATPQQIAAARAMQRKAQWRTDFVNAENSMGFHAPGETARLLAEAVDFARQGQIALSRPGFEPTIVPQHGTGPAASVTGSAAHQPPTPGPAPAPPK